MRLPAIALAFVALLGCSKGKSKLDADRTGDVDALWDLAPDGTQLGIVASARAVGLGFRAITALRAATAEGDLALAKPQLEALVTAMFGAEGAKPEDAGYATDRAFAMFQTKDGVLGIIPVGNRDTFIAAKKGNRGSGSADDTVDTNTCRELRGHYVCVTAVEMFDRLGKGSLKGKLKPLGARGDAELYLADMPLLGENKGDLLVAAQLEPGQVSLHGRWTGAPDGPLATVAGSAAPKPDTTGASGFVALDVTPLLANAPAIPVAGGVTFDQLAKSLTGPLTAVIPSGSVDVQIFVPLADPKPAQTVIENCNDVGQFFTLADKQVPGACRIKLQGTNALELDAWVEGSTLRLGAKKGPAPKGKAGGMTTWGRELSNGTWTAAFWGRGTMLNTTGIESAKEEVTREVALGVHAMALVNELGVGVRVDKDDLRFRAVMRTAWANPPNVIADIVKIQGSEILAGKATEPAKAIAAKAPGSPFAADFDAGQGGLMVPAAMIGLGTAVVVPAIMRIFGGGGDATDEVPSAPAMNQADLVTLLLHAYVEEAYPRWKADHPKDNCPASLADVAKYFGEDVGAPITSDPWGHELVMKCSGAGFTVKSVGPDGTADTADDVSI